jgi:plasmid stabilization system protein ParE
VRLELHPEARAELRSAALRSAALWYDERRPGLGDEFISEVSAALDRIGDAPESYPPWPRTRAAGPVIRKATIPRFPYVIAFEEHEQHLLVLAVAHAKRRPLYWLTRTSP